MQRSLELRASPFDFHRAGLFKALRAAFFFIFGGLLEVAPVGATEINTLSANANCDTVTIRQEKRQQNDDKIDWYAFDRKHREYTGQELLPEHKPKEPEADTVIGCAIKNIEGSTRQSADQLDDAEVAKMEFAGWAKDSAVAQETEDEAEQEGVVRPQNKSSEPEKDIINYLKTEASLFVQGAAILVLTAIAVAIAFGLRFLSKIAFGLMQRRRVCHIPCSLVTTLNHEVVGHMTVIGLRSFRFVPLNQGEMAHFKRTLDEPEMFYFSVLVGDMEFEVFVDGIRGYYSPVAFDVRLTPKMQKQILEFSTITPQIGQLIVVPYNIKKHKAHIKNRANKTVYMDQTNAKKANQKSGHSAIRKALSNAGIGFGHST